MRFIIISLLDTRNILRTSTIDILGLDKNSTLQSILWGAVTYAGIIFWMCAANERWHCTERRLSLAGCIQKMIPAYVVHI